MTSLKPNYQVVIIGGGIAGCSTALTLYAQGIRSILLIHQPVSADLKAGEILQPQARALLEELDLFEDFQRVPYLTAYGSCSAWGSDELMFNDNIFRLHGNGYALDRLVFDKLFLEKVASKGITVIHDSITDFQKMEENQWALHLKGGNQVKANFIVDASGRQSHFAKQLGIPRIQFDDLHAVYTFWRGHHPKLPRHSFVESTQDGWCYSATLPDDLFVIAVFSDKGTLKKQRLKEVTNFKAFVKTTVHTKHLLSDTAQLVQINLTVANSSILDQIGSDEGWLAVGDAASAYDPLSAIGIAKAMSDGLNAADAIVKWFKGEPQVIDKYTQHVQRAFDQYLKQKYQYYKMEERWTDHAFWKSRQTWASIHPQRKIIHNPSNAVRLANRMLSSAELSRILALCQNAIPAHEVVRIYQNHTGNIHPDWRIIQALGYLVENKFLIAA